MNRRVSSSTLHLVAAGIRTKIRQKLKVVRIFVMSSQRAGLNKGSSEISCNAAFYFARSSKTSFSAQCISAVLAMDSMLVSGTISHHTGANNYSHLPLSSIFIIDELGKLRPINWVGKIPEDRKQVCITMHQSLP